MTFRPNVLDTYDNATYHITWFMVDEELLLQSYNESGSFVPDAILKAPATRKKVIAESGVEYNTHITNLSITSVAAPSANYETGISTHFNFTVEQPNGANLIDIIENQCNKFNIKNRYTNTYFIHIKFYGYNVATGELETVQLKSADGKSVGQDWVWPVILAKMDIDINSSGSTYDIKAMASYNLPFTNNHGILNIVDGTDSAEATVEQFAMRLSDAFNRQEQAKTFEVPDEYEIVVAPELASEVIKTDMAAEEKHLTYEDDDSIEQPPKRDSNDKIQYERYRDALANAVMLDVDDENDTVDVIGITDPSKPPYTVQYGYWIHNIASVRHGNGVLKSTNFISDDDIDLLHPITQKKGDQFTEDDFRYLFYGEGDWVWPVDDSTQQIKISSYPALIRKHPVNGIDKPHLGIDVAMMYGTAVVSARDGVVVAAGLSGTEKSGFGNRVVVKHTVTNNEVANLIKQGRLLIVGYLDEGAVLAKYTSNPQGMTNIYSTYAHLSKITATVNSVVTAGQKIGEMGNTGSSTGTHLHFQLNIDQPPQGTNPRLFIKSVINSDDLAKGGIFNGSGDRKLEDVNKYAYNKTKYLEHVQSTISDIYTKQEANTKNTYTPISKRDNNASVATMATKIQPGTHILTIIKEKLSTIDYFQKAAKKANNNEPSSLFRVYSSSYPTKYDPSRNDYARKFKYIIKPFIMPSLATTVKDATSVKTYSENVLAIIKQKGLLNKRYDYIFTGKNTSVLSIDMKFNTSWGIVVPFRNGSTTTAEANIVNFSKWTPDRFESYLASNEKQNMYQTDKAKQQNAKINIDYYQKNPDSRSDFDVPGFELNNPAEQNRKIIRAFSIFKSKYSESNPEAGKDEVIAALGTDADSAAKLYTAFVNAAGSTFGSNGISDQPIRLISSPVTPPETTPQDSEGQNIFNSIYDQAIGPDMMLINMTIKGDPFWLMPGPFSSKTFDEQVQDNSSDSMVYGGENVFYFNAGFPSENLSYNGLDSSESGLLSSFVKGLYSAITIEHTFESGKFTQLIKANRLLQISMSSTSELHEE